MVPMFGGDLRCIRRLPGHKVQPAICKAGRRRGCFTADVFIVHNSWAEGAGSQGMAESSGDSDGLTLNYVKLSLIALVGESPCLFTSKEISKLRSDLEEGAMFKGGRIAAAVS